MFDVHGEVQCLSSGHGNVPKILIDETENNGGGKILIAAISRTDEAKQIRKESMKAGKDYTPFQGKRIDFKESDTMNTITCATQKDNLIIQVNSATKDGYETAHEGDSINLSMPNSKTRRGRVGVGVGVAQTLDTQCNQSVLQLRDGRDNRSCLKSGRQTELGIEGQSIRRLTEIECERLQGFKDNHTEYGNYDGVVKKISRTQRYKMVGNAVTVDVVQLISDKLFNLIRGIEG